MATPKRDISLTYVHPPEPLIVMVVGFFLEDNQECLPDDVSGHPCAARRPNVERESTTSLSLFIIEPQIFACSSFFHFAFPSQSYLSSPMPMFDKHSLSH